MWRIKLRGLWFLLSGVHFLLGRQDCAWAGAHPGDYSVGGLGEEGGALCSEVGWYHGQVEVSKGGRRQFELGVQRACWERQGWRNSRQWIQTLSKEKAHRRDAQREQGDFTCNGRPLQNLLWVTRQRWSVIQSTCQDGLWQQSEIYPIAWSSKGAPCPWEHCPLSLYQWPNWHALLLLF